MSSPGAASDISSREAHDLLRRLIAESINVQAVFWGRGSVLSSMRGVVSLQTPGLVQIMEGKKADGASLSFGLKEVIKFKYGDDRAFPPWDVPGLPRKVSALIFVYPDGAQVALFELANAC